MPTELLTQNLSDISILESAASAGQARLNSIISANKSGKKRRGAATAAPRVVVNFIYFICNAYLPTITATIGDSVPF